LQSLETQLHQREEITLQRADLETHLNQLNKSKHLTIYNQSLQVIQQQRQTWEQQLGFLRQQYQNFSQKNRLEQERLF